VAVKLYGEAIVTLTSGRLGLHIGLARLTIRRNVHSDWFNEMT